MKNIVIGVSLAPYRVDYYNSLHDRMDCEIFFQKKAFADQLFSMEELTGQCTYTPRYLKTISLGKSRCLCLGLRKLIRELRPDFIISNEFSIVTIQLILLRWFSAHKFKIISQCDDSFDMLVNEAFSKLHEWSQRLCMKYIDDIILLDNKAEGWYRQKYSKGFFFPLIINEKNIDSKLREEVQSKAGALRQTYGLESRHTILFAGRFVEVKNLFTLIDACAILGAQYRLVLVGDGELRAALEHYAAGKGIDALFPGRCNGAELYAWYACADCFVLPSLKEAFGAVTNEAMVFGCNCCVSYSAGSSILVEEGKNGYICNPHSAEDIALKISKTVLLPVNPGRGTKMIYSFDSCMDRLETMLSGQK